MKRSRNGLVFGVCSGIGKSIGIGEELGVIFGILLLLTTDWFWWVYLILAFIMPLEDDEQESNRCNP